MRTAAVLMLLVFGSVAHAADATKLQALATEHCVRCHDGDLAFDLHTLPAVEDGRRWQQILSMVEDARMPPPKQTGTIAERFPMDPQSRASFIKELEIYLGPALKTPRRPKHLSFSEWQSIALELARRVMPIADAQRLFDGFVGMAAPDQVPPTYLAELRQASMVVCDAILRHEEAAGSADRRLIPPWPRGNASAAAISSMLQPLYTALFNTSKLPAAEVKHSITRQVYAATRSWPKAWTAQCVSYLAGPHLMYLYSDAELVRHDD